MVADQIAVMLGATVPRRRTRGASPTSCIFILSLFSSHLKSSGKHRGARKTPDIWPFW